MTARNIIPNMRAAARTKLLALSLPVSVTGSVTIAGAVLTASGATFVTDGHSPGDYLTLAGLSAANNGTRRVVGVTQTVLTFADAFATNETVGASTISGYRPEIAWEREAFTPVAGQPFISEVFRRIGGKPVPFGGQWRHDLLLSLTLQWPSGQGTLGIESMAGRLLELYRPGTGLSFGGNVGKVVSADVSPLNEESVWTACAVTASVMAWTAN